MSRLSYKLKETNLAIVLLDLIGSTKFVQGMGHIKAARWLQYHDRLTRSLCYKFNGREIDRSDGFLMSFESPVDAVNFSLTYQLTIPAKTKIQCRIGIHFGRIVEVHQHELIVGAGAKQVELEGIAKNIAARTMSLCQAGQVLLTKEAMEAVRWRQNRHTPPNTNYACVGLYKFKGVKEPQTIYAAGTTVKSLQPPPGSEKVKRIGGPKKVKVRLRNMQLKEAAAVVAWNMSKLFLLYVLFCLCWLMSTSLGRDIVGIRQLNWLGDLYLYVVNLLTRR